MCLTQYRAFLHSISHTYQHNRMFINVVVVVGLLIELERWLTIIYSNHDHAHTYRFRKSTEKRWANFRHFHNFIYHKPHQLLAQIHDIYLFCALNAVRCSMYTLNMMTKSSLWVMPAAKFYPSQNGYVYFRSMPQVTMYITFKQFCVRVYFSACANIICLHCQAMQ